MCTAFMYYHVSPPIICIVLKKDGVEYKTANTFGMGRVLCCYNRLFPYQKASNCSWIKQKPRPKQENLKVMMVSAGEYPDA